MIIVRPLFFAFEDMMQITKLVIETLQRLPTVSNESSSAKEFWK